MINRSDLKTQAKEQLLKYFDTLNLEIGNKLPNEDELARMVGVSRVTIRAALNDLSSEGVIFRRHGKGTFINKVFRDIKVSFDPVMQFADMIKNSGHVPSMRLLGAQVEPAHNQVSEKLCLAKNSLVVVSKKLYYADDKLCAYCVDYVDKALVPDNYIDSLSSFNGSIFNFMYKCAKIKVEWDKVEISVVNTDDILELQKYGRENSFNPHRFLLLDGVNYNENDKPIVYVNEFINTDVLRFNLIRHRSISYD